MRQRRTFFLPVGSRLIALAILALLATMFFSYRHSSSIPVVEAQTRRQLSKARPKPKDRAPLFLTNFRHESHRPPRTELNCSYCHTISSGAAFAVAAATKISIKRYPYHDSCLECHGKKKRPYFFSGAKPVICSVCHTRVSPRTTARDVYRKFPKQTDLTLRQFPGYFPHDKHCSVISEVKQDAELEKNCNVKQDPDVEPVSCADCHKIDERSPKPILLGGDEIFTPATGTFKTTLKLPNDPASAHASCFRCHWETSNEGKKPSRNNCNGCHRPPKEFKDLKHPRKDSLLSLMGASWFKDWPREWPQRISARFNHDGGEREHPKEECITCHKNLMILKTLNIPDVLISSCSECHGVKARTSIFTEMKAEDKDSENRCSGCHTGLIGSTPPPCSHYRLDKDKYLTGNYPKISERCKE